MKVFISGLFKREYHFEIFSFEKLLSIVSHRFLNLQKSVHQKLLGETIPDSYRNSESDAVLNFFEKRQVSGRFVV